MARHIPHFAIIQATVASALLICSTTANAADVGSVSGRWLHIDGYTIHFDAPGSNPWLVGSGLTFYREPKGRFMRAWEADLFKDSANEPSGYVGHSWTLPLRSHVGVGVIGAVMYHRNFQRQTGFPILPVALPFLQVAGKKVMARMYYVPPVRRKSDHQVAFQLLVPF